MLPTTRYEGSLTAANVPLMEPQTSGGAAAGGGGSSKNVVGPYKLRKVSDVAGQMARVDPEDSTGLECVGGAEVRTY